MKSKIFFVAIVSALLLTIGCNSAGNIDKLLENQITRQEVFDKITTDHEMMTQLMESMMNSEHSKMMMKEHEGMKDMMMGDGEMMNMMKDKPDMMHGMMSEMMKDEKMMGHMMQMMNKEGMMSDDCMQSCMKMMGDKGMDMGKMEEASNSDNHESHNH